MNRKHLLLIIVLIIATFFRVYQFTTVPPGLYPDEAMNGNNALNAVREGGNYRVFYPDNNGREGLFINLQAQVIRFFGGREPWMLRSISPVFGVLTVLGVYLLAAELFGAVAGLVAAFLIATSFWHVNFSRIGFRAISAPFYLTFALYLLLAAYRWIREKRNTVLVVCAAVLGGAFFGLGFHSYIAYRVAPVIIGLAMLFEFRRTVKNKIFVKYAAVSASYLAAFIVAATPLALYFMHNSGSFMGRPTQVSVLASPTPVMDLFLNIAKTAQMLFFMGDFNWRHNLAGQPELYLPVGIFFLGGLAVGVRILWKTVRRLELSREAEGYWLIFVWLAATATPVIVSNEGLPHALRAILMIPAVFIICAIGALWVCNFAKTVLPPRTVKACIVVLACLILAHTYITYFLKWAPDKNTLAAFSARDVEIGRMLEALSPDIPKYVVVPDSSVHAGGYPMSAQTVMFITDTFNVSEQMAKNIHYVVQGHETDIPPGSLVFKI